MQILAKLLKFACMICQLALALELAITTNVKEVIITARVIVAPYQGEQKATFNVYA